MQHRDSDENLWLTITASGPAKPTLQEVVDTLRSNCSGLHMRRVDEANGSIEARFLVEFANFAELEATRNALHRLSLIAFCTSSQPGGCSGNRLALLRTYNRDQNSLYNWAFLSTLLWATVHRNCAFRSG